MHNEKHFKMDTLPWYMMIYGGDNFGFFSFICYFTSTSYIWIKQGYQCPLSLVKISHSAPRLNLWLIPSSIIACSCSHHGSASANETDRVSSIQVGHDHIFTGRNEVVAKVIFLHLFVILFTGGGGSASVHAGILPPGTRPPLEQTHPSGTRPPPGTRLQHTVYERPVRILLECILVVNFGHNYP